MELCKGLNESAKIIHQNNREKGFWDKDRNMGETLMLIVGEVSEAMEAHQKGQFANVEMFEQDIVEGYDFKRAFDLNIKDSYEDEISDIVIRVLDLCAAKGIDIEKHINLKVEYNKSRPRLHGKRY